MVDSERTTRPPAQMSSLPRRLRGNGDGHRAFDVDCYVPPHVARGRVCGVALVPGTTARANAVSRVAGPRVGLDDAHTASFETVAARVSDSSRAAMPSPQTE